MIKWIKKLFGPSTDLEALAKDGAILLDVRTKSEYASGHAKGSKNIPLDQVSKELERIKNWDKPVIAFCASGMRSAAAVRILKSKGIVAHNARTWQRVAGWVK